MIDWSDPEVQRLAVEGRLGPNGEIYEAVVRWSPDDIVTLYDDKDLEISRESAEELLGSISRHLTDRLIELGWTVMEDLIGTEEDFERQAAEAGVEEDE